MRVALGLEYNGATFSGWQSQTNGAGIQDALESAIKQISGHSVRVHAAGRTDTGVHATMQIVHFDTLVERPNSAWVRGVNAFLPESVRVLWATPIDDSFHARFSAKQRSYEYVLLNRPQAPAIHSKQVGWYHLPLDIHKMQEAVAYLLGEHDFSAFRASECQAKSPIRTMLAAGVKKSNDYVVFNFTANAFLQHQVRNMIGALVYIGNGKHSPILIVELLAQKNRQLSPPTFSPAGLYLTGVQYPEQYALPSMHQHLSLI